MTSDEKQFRGKTARRHATTSKAAFRRRTGAVIGLAAVLGLALAGCGTSNGGSATTPAAATSAAATSAATTAEATPAATPAATAGNTASSMASTAPSRPATTPATGAGPALCTAASLKGSVDDTGGGAAGHIYMKLILTNKSSSTCILNGYPGVSLVKAGTTTPIGAPADRDASAPSKGPITLAPGKGATAVLAYTQAGNYQGCKRVQADDIMVYPPSAYDELVIPHPLTACSNTDINLLKIGAFQP
ncbi:DUF4232 domain-containing protein [Arthrobacter sp.]|jgi:hypothetical protein|uniref:DUF4232 domain-containing protein n=1 Tax=Arthrobacter sp. TaxID=1667 RepID=UPI002585C7B7|nr:DUF4232 domain-containing protein [Arthrobacter sp.]